MVGLIVSLLADHFGLSYMHRSSQELVTQTFDTIRTDRDVGRAKIGGYCKRNFHLDCDGKFITSWHASQPMSKYQCGGGGCHHGI